MSKQPSSGRPYYACRDAVSQDNANAGVLGTRPVLFPLQITAAKARYIASAYPDPTCAPKPDLTSHLDPRSLKPSPIQCRSSNTDRRHRRGTTRPHRARAIPPLSLCSTSRSPRVKRRATAVSTAVSLPCAVVGFAARPANAVWNASTVVVNHGTNATII